MTIYCRHPYVRDFDSFFEQCVNCGHLIELPVQPVVVDVVTEVVVVDDYGYGYCDPVVVVDTPYYDPGYDNCGFDGGW